MNEDSRRITLISRHKQLSARNWKNSPESRSRIIVLDSFAILRAAVARTLVELDMDIERIVLDRCASASEYLSLLAQLPYEFAGDVLMIRDDESGFLSASGRGGDRVLYSLAAPDLRFYLETHGLLSAAAETASPVRSSVLQFRQRAVA
jgi:hypothetical protein